VLHGSQETSLSKKTLQTLGAYDILAPDGLVIAQHFKRDDLPKKSGNLTLIKESRYGDTVLSIYRKVNSKSQ
jgi:16S rRNA G966 N2-methylase RsmD